MSFLLHETLIQTATGRPQRTLVSHEKSGEMIASDMLVEVRRMACFLHQLGMQPDDRIAIYLPKLPATAVAFYAASYAGGVFVPVNPVLKSAQVAHILNDCDVTVLLTSPERLHLIEPAIRLCPALRHIVLTDAATDTAPLPVALHALSEMEAVSDDFDPPPRVDNDMAAILYTSGSTGRPKGVVISHRNIVIGAISVAQYLGINAEDRLLAVLPFSFDYGLNQLTSAVLKGAQCVLHDFLLPKDVVRAVVKHRITGLAAVPPLWAQLAPLDWPTEAKQSLRYITNSGGSMPARVLAQLRERLPNTAPVLMYGLTEAFRSTYLPPNEIERRPDSIGKAIPNAEIMVVKSNGSLAQPGEPGELVHRGALVALGYWNDRTLTAERFRPAPDRPSGITTPEYAVWSGDTVVADEEGFLYFVGRTDSMIKTSGYRVSPEEIEEVAYRSANVIQTAAAVGVPHETLGQGIVLAIQPIAGETLSIDELAHTFCTELPGYMVPLRIFIREGMPHNPNGKIGRNALAQEYANVLADVGVVASVT